MRAYFVVSLLTGACSEELRALTWSHLDLEGDASGFPQWMAALPRAAASTISSDSRSGRTFPRCVDHFRGDDGSCWR
jgi:hypothetical protein